MPTKTAAKKTPAKKTPAKKATAKKAPAAEKLKPRTRLGRNGWTYIDPISPMDLAIMMQDIAKGVCGDPRLCVVAQAILRQLSAVCAGGIQVSIGACISKIWIYETMTKLRYTTPPALARALREFDRTKVWNLDPGNYQLRPLSDSYLRPNRWDKKKITVAGKKGVQSTFAALWSTSTKDESTRAIPTRVTFIEPPSVGDLKSPKKTSPKKKAAPKKKAVATAK